jgi:hypothetical protein
MGCLNCRKLSKVTGLKLPMMSDVHLVVLPVFRIGEATYRRNEKVGKEVRNGNSLTKLAESADGSSLLDAVSSWRAGNGGPGARTTTGGRG